MPLSSGACGTTRWPGFKVFALCAGYAHILARLRSPLQDFCLRKGAINCGKAATFPFEPSEPLEPSEPGPLCGPLLPTKKAHRITDGLFLTV